MLKPTGTLDTLAVSCRPLQRPPAGPPIVLVHGAANSAGVWTFWQHELARLGYASYAIDLRGHGDGRLRIRREASRRPDGKTARHHGWSMGGLAALMAAAPGGVAACVCLEPSPPVLELDESLPLRSGVFGPLACPDLLVAGTGARNKAVGPDDALFPGADYYEAMGASHWGLVLSRRTLAKMVPVVLRWLVAQNLNNSLHGGSR